MTLLSLSVGRITSYKSIFNPVCNYKNFKNHVSLSANISIQFFAESRLTTSFLYLMNTFMVNVNRVDGVGVSK